MTDVIHKARGYILFWIFLERVRLKAKSERLRCALKGEILEITPRGASLIRYCERLLQSGGQIEHKTYADLDCEEFIRQVSGKDDANEAISLSDAYVVQQYFFALIPEYKEIARQAKIDLTKEESNNAVFS